MRPPGTFEVGRQAGELGAGPGLGARPIDGLVAVAEAVDELALQRLLGQQRTAIDRRAHLGLRQLASFRDAMDDLPAYRGEQRVHFLAMRRGHLGFGQTVDRSLELFAMVEFRSDPEEIEGAL